MKKCFSNLKKIRKDNGITLQDMAELIDLKTASSYLKKESGKVEFTLREATIISQCFGEKIEDIFLE